MPVWLNYVGIVAAAIGAFTGIAGFAMGLISYRRSKLVKALDLRLELRKEMNALEAIVRGLPHILEKTEQSRAAVTAVMGASGASQKFLEDLDDDRQAVRLMQSELPDSNFDYGKFSDSELENHLVKVHAARISSSAVKEKYLPALATDDKWREQRAATMQEAARVMIRMHTGATPGR